ncbi:hypothetical protein PG988_016405 [Apiospora saccharicola]
MAKPLTNPAIFFASQTHKPNFKLLLAYSLYLIRMERLPQEVVARIAGYLSRIHEGKLIRPSLATLSGSWQYAIEALPFQSLQLTSDHLEVFVAALANGRTRRRFLRSLCLDIILPRYSDEDCARYETADDRAGNNHVFSHHLSALLQELSQWPGGGKLNLCIDMHSPMDGAHRGPDRFDHARILRRRRTERGGSGGTGPIDAHAQRRGGARRRGLRVPLSPAGRGHAPPADGPRAPARPHAVASERLPRGDAAAGQGAWLFSYQAPGEMSDWDEYVGCDDALSRARVFLHAGDWRPDGGVVAVLRGIGKACHCRLSSVPVLVPSALRPGRPRDNHSGPHGRTILLLYRFQEFGGLFPALAFIVTAAREITRGR